MEIRERRDEVRGEGRGKNAESAQGTASGPPRRLHEIPELQDLTKARRSAKRAATMLRSPRCGAPALRALREGVPGAASCEQSKASRI